MKQVFTNGCFDLLHRGHVDFLRRARELGDSLTVAINSDESVRKIKGPARPIQHQEERAEILRGLRSVDAVLIFDEATPIRLIEELRPSVLVKGGDWPIDEIVGSDVVRKNGGEVVSLPILAGYSTTSIVRRLSEPLPQPLGGQPATEEAEVLRGIEESIFVKRLLLKVCGKSIIEAANLLVGTLRSGNKILLFGNGGSAAHAEHIAAELAGRYRRDRKALPAIALTGTSSTVTAISNDYGFDRVFARQIEALACAGDAVVAISTSGNSRNVVSAVMEARALGCKVVGLTGQGGKRLAALCDAPVVVPSDSPPRIQECHITIGHLWSEAIEHAVGVQ